MSFHDDEPDEPQEAPQAIPVGWRDLSEEALRGVLEDLVTRGEPDEMSMEARVGQLLTAIKQGRTKLYFDPIEEAIFLRNS